MISSVTIDVRGDVRFLIRRERLISLQTAIREYMADNSYDFEDVENMPDNPRKRYLMDVIELDRQLFDILGP